MNITTIGQRKQKLQAEKKNLQICLIVKSRTFTKITRLFEV